MFASGTKLHWIKNLYLRWRYGAGCCDIYDLNSYLAKKILKALKEFRKNVYSYPGDMKTKEEWEKTLDEMIWSFNYLLDGEEWTATNIDELYKREQQGFVLFGKYFRDLWK